MAFPTGNMIHKAMFKIIELTIAMLLCSYHTLESGYAHMKTFPKLKLVATHMISERILHMIGHVIEVRPIRPDLSRTAWGGQTEVDATES